MSKHKKSINNIIHDHLIGNISLEDQKRLHDWLESSQENRARYEFFIKEAHLFERYDEYAKVDEAQAWEIFRKKHLLPKTAYWKRLLPYAAILMIPLIGAAIWLWTLNGVESETTGLTHKVRAVMAKSEQIGKKKATLILPTGQKVRLHSTPEKILRQSASSPIQPADTLSGVEPITPNNRLTTHGDSEYWMVFDDGTTVHLNYNTTLMYPSHFSSASRTVYLDGEAYFQVAKDKRPFRVVTRDGIVKEYGTSFNVNTHAECTKVVLVEGAISVTPNEGDERHMSPGELAVLYQEMSEVQISKVNIEPYVAWNSGRFVFEHCSLESLMSVISRWYNKEVVFESEEIRQIRFTGDVDRYGSIVPIMKAIQRVTGLDITVDEKAIVLKKK